jgi:uncharacterized coiled-coil DUF342 family protein
MGMSDEVTKIFHSAEELIYLAKTSGNIELQKKATEFEQEAITLATEILKYEEKIKALEEAVRLEARSERNKILAVLVVVGTVILFILAWINGWDMGLPAGG